MKTNYPIAAWLLWGFGLLLSLWFLYSSGGHIYRQWTVYEITARPMFFVQSGAALLGFIALAWLIFPVKKEMSTVSWIVLFSVSGLQIIVAILHMVSFWASFQGTTFG